MTAATPSAAALTAAGAEHARQGRWPDAEACFRAAWRQDLGDKVARHSLATALLALGRYCEGFELYALRRELPQFPAPPQLPWPEWRGESLSGRHILLFPEQGLGDQIQFARFAPQLAASGAEVTLFCAPALTRCFAALGVRVVAASGAAEFPEPDVWAFGLDVPGRLGVEPDTLPNAPYLRGTPRSLGGARIGIVRRGNPAHGNDANRSMPDDCGCRSRPRAWRPRTPARATCRTPPT